jgi:VWFA-related protein
MLSHAGSPGSRRLISWLSVHRLILLLLMLPLLAQRPSPDPLVLVRFHLDPRKGEVAKDLRADEIRILEDGVPQKIAVLEKGRGSAAIPVELLLLFDCRAGLRNARIIDRNPLDLRLLDQGPNVRIGIYCLSDSPFELAEPTRDKARLQSAMNGVLGVTSPSTTLFKGVMQMVESPTAAPNAAPNAARMLVIISDGEASDHWAVDKTIDTAKDYGVPLYPVLLKFRRATSGESDSLTERTQAMDANSSSFRFQELAKATGGIAPDLIVSGTFVSALLKTLAVRMESDYIVGYSPAAAAGKPRRRAVKVELNAKQRGQLSGGVRNVVR